MNGRTSSALAAAIGIWLLAYFTGAVLIQSQPVGRVSGVVYLAETHRKFAGATVYLEAKSGYTRTRYVTSGRGGRFSFSSVPAGDYNIWASTNEHAVRSSRISVLEGKETPIALDLSRSLPVFSVVVHQQTFTTSERPMFAVKGYQNWKVPSGQDSFTLTVYHTQMSSMLSTTASAKAFATVGRSYDAAPTLSPQVLHISTGNSPKLLFRKRVRITKTDTEGFYYQRYWFPHLPTGLYLLDLRHGADTGASWLMVTNTALVTKRCRSQVLAYVVNIVTGKPVGGSVVSFFRTRGLVAKATTDARGLALLTVPPLPRGEQAGASYLTAGNHGDEALCSNYSNNSGSQEEYVVFSYTDRPIYRPGQTIQFKCIVRRRRYPQDSEALTAVASLNGSGTGDYTVPAGTMVHVELRDPSGVAVLKRDYRLNRFGAISGHVDLLGEASTGVYTLFVTPGGLSYAHTHDIVVSAYKKPQIKLTATSTAPQVIAGQTATVNVSAAYYFGAPVAGASVSYSVYSSPDWASDFPDDYDYQDGDESAIVNTSGDTYYGAQVTSGSAVLDANGNAQITFPTREVNVPGSNLVQSKIFDCSVTLNPNTPQSTEQDVSVRVVQGDFHLAVEPAGYLAEHGKTTNVVVTALGYHGTARANRAVTLQMYYEDTASVTYKRVAVGTLHATTNMAGKAVFAVVPPKNGELILKAVASDSAGRVITARNEIWVESAGSDDSNATANDLTIFTDRRQYTPGQTARVLISSRGKGYSALVTLEGSRIYRSQVIVLSHGNTIVHLPIRADYGPNLFIDVCYVSHKTFASSEASLRVANTNAKLQVTVKPVYAPGQTVFRPEQRVQYHVHVADAHGQPVHADFCLAVVDEAIYALRQDHPAAILRKFYPRRYNQVDTEYSFATLYMGDADKAEPKIVTRKKFPDTAYWAADVETDSHGNAVVSFVLPDNLTRWRATAIAQTLQTEVGWGTCDIQVTKPLVVDFTTPRTLVQKDTAEVTALLHNNTSSSQTVLTKLTTMGLQVVGASQQSITMASGTISQVTWTVHADTPGPATLNAVAWTVPSSGGRQFTDGMQLTIPVKAYGYLHIATVSGLVTAAQQQSENVRVNALTSPQQVSGVVHITPSPITAITGGLQNLADYPYGCVEQTSSRLIADVAVKLALRQLGGNPADAVPDIDNMMREGIARLYRLQHSSGGWGWWHFDAENPTMTAIALMDLEQARALGAPISMGVLRKATAFSLKEVKTCPTADRPALLYALKLAGQRRVVQRMLAAMPGSAFSNAGAAYGLMASAGSPAATARFKHLLVSRVSLQGELAHWGGGAYTFSDNVDSTALALRALATVDEQNGLVAPALRWLMLQNSNGWWVSTRDTADSLMALFTLMQHSPPTVPTGQVNVLVNGVVKASVAVGGTNLNEKQLVVQLPPGTFHTGSNQVTFQRTNGTSAVNYSLTIRQLEPGTPVAGTVRGLAITRQYMRVVSSTINGLVTAPLAGNVKAGSIIRVHLVVKAPKEMSYVLIEDPFPAGLEPDVRGDADVTDDWNYWYSGVDVRDDRVAFFARGVPAGTSVIDYTLHAQAAGHFNALPALVQAMYAPQEQASTQIQQVVVRP